MTNRDIEADIARWVRPEIRALTAYQVPDASGLVKLDAMENPYVWSPALREEWAAQLEQVHVNRYPDPHAQRLAKALRSAMDVPADAGMLLGNGSDEIIQMLAMAVGGPGRALLSVEPGFVMYRMIAGFTGMDYVGIPLTTDFQLDTDAIIRHIEHKSPALIFLAVPNNPTGNLFDEGDLLRIIEAAQGLVVIDEAYAPFTDLSFLDRLGRNPNLLVMRTVSKMGLAGLRLGLLAGPQPWINEIDKVRLPYNINTLTQASAEFALSHKSLLDQQTQKIRRDRETVFRELSAMPDIEPYPSDANFILFRTKESQGSRIHRELREKGILIKNLDGAHPMLKDCLRVTVGTAHENRRFLDALATC